MSFYSQIPDNRDEVYFTEYALYYTLRNEGVMADITDALTMPLTEYGEEESIIDKLSSEQRAYSVSYTHLWELVFLFYYCGVYS